jgi:hypothetical protein
MRPLILLFVLAGCAGGGDPTFCEGYTTDDACITQENLAQCEEMAAECPNGVVVLESCPLQFACE